MADGDPEDPVDPTAGVDTDPFAAIDEGRAPELNVEQFVEDLESMMIAGHSNASIRRWAMQYHHVDAKTLVTFIDLVKKSWAIECQTIAQTKIRRDHLRVRYLETYDAAMADGEYLPAVKALDSIAKLDGLTSPDVNLTQVMNVGSGSYPGQITSGVRERIQSLAETMRLRAEQRAISSGKVIDITVAEAPPKKNGTNGK